MDVDPKVHALAEEFVDDELRTLGDGLDLDVAMRQRRDALIVRTARAMQQAIEQELDDIRTELEL